MRKKLVVRKANDLVEAKFKLSIEEQKLVLYIIALIQPEDQDFKQYTVTVNEFCKFTGYRPDNVYSNFVEVCKGLMSKPIVLFRQDSVIGEEEVTVLNWLAEAKCNSGKGSITLTFSPTLKSYLLQIKKNFTSYALDNVKKMKSIYGIRLYELLKQYQTFGKRSFEVEKLKEILCVSDQYSDYFDFKRNVILMAQKDIQAHCDICFEFKEFKAGRRVTQLMFLIYPNTKNEAVHSESKEEPQIMDSAAPKRSVAAKPMSEPKINLKQLLSFIQENISDQQLKDIYNKANGDSKLIRRRYYDLINGTWKYDDFVKGLIFAIRNPDVTFEPEAEKKSQRRSESPRNQFNNFSQRNNNHEELERLELEIFKKDIQHLNQAKQDQTYSRLDQIDTQAGVHWDDDDDFDL
jgi:plasmid replication initiation protein